MLVQVCLAYMGSTFSTIQSFIGDHNNAGLITVVIGKFHKGNIPIPTSRENLAHNPEACSLSLESLFQIVHLFVDERLY